MRPIVLFDPATSAPTLSVQDVTSFQAIIDPFVVANENSKSELVKLLRHRRRTALYNLAAALLSLDSRGPDPVRVKALFRFQGGTLISKGGRAMTPGVELMQAIPKPGGALALLLPGCQTEPMIEIRVLLGIEVLSYVDSPAFVLLSGGHPKRGVPEIKNESAKMAEIIRSHASNKLGSAWESRIHLRFDSSATNTEENIRNFEQFVQLEEDITGILIASSSMHLPRLWNGLRFCRSFTTALFGSEDVDAPSGIALTPRYARSLCYEVFRSKEFLELAITALSPAESVRGILRRWTR